MRGGARPEVPAGNRASGLTGPQICPRLDPGPPAARIVTTKCLCSQGVLFPRPGPPRPHKEVLSGLGFCQDKANGDADPPHRGATRALRTRRKEGLPGALSPVRDGLQLSPSAGLHEECSRGRGVQAARGDFNTVAFGCHGPRLPSIALSWAHSGVVTY